MLQTKISAVFRTSFSIYQENEMTLFVTRIQLQYFVSVVIKCLPDVFSKEKKNVQAFISLVNIEEFLYFSHLVLYGFQQYQHDI